MTVYREDLTCFKTRGQIFNPRQMTQKIGLNNITPFFRELKEEDCYISNVLSHCKPTKALSMWDSRWSPPIQLILNSCVNHAYNQLLYEHLVLPLDAIFGHCHAIMQRTVSMA